MLALTEKQMLMQALGQVIVDEVNKSVAPLLERITHLEKALGDMPVPQNGKDGKDADPAMILDAIKSSDAILRTYVDEKCEHLNQIAIATGKNVLSEVDDAILRAVVSLKPEKGDKGDPGEKGEDGKDGRNGTDGQSLSLDDVAEHLSILVGEAVAKLPVPVHCVGGHIDRDGHLFIRFSDGSAHDVGEVAGKDGKSVDPELARAQIADFLATIEKPKDGKDGIDGFGFDDITMEYDGERKLEIIFFKDERAKVFTFTLPIPLDRGIWESREYEKADTVQRDGSTWIAERATSAQPGLPDSGWRLCTKRGQAGRDGKSIQGPPGPPGRDGRDLTQMGLDGRKW